MRSTCFVMTFTAECLSARFGAYDQACGRLELHLSEKSFEVLPDASAPSHSRRCTPAFCGRLTWLGAGWTRVVPQRRWWVTVWNPHQSPGDLTALLAMSARPVQDHTHRAYTPVVASAFWIAHLWAMSKLLFDALHSGEQRWTGCFAGCRRNQDERILDYPGRQATVARLLDSCVEPTVRTRDFNATPCWQHGHVERHPGIPAATASA